MAFPSPEASGPSSFPSDPTPSALSGPTRSAPPLRPPTRRRAAGQPDRPHGSIRARRDARGRAGPTRPSVARVACRRRTLGPRRRGRDPPRRHRDQQRPGARPAQPGRQHRRRRVRGAHRRRRRSPARSAAPATRSTARRTRASASSAPAPASTARPATTGRPARMARRPRTTETIDATAFDDGTLLKPVAVDTTVADGKGLMRSYKVRAGDTLTGIARKFGVSMMTVWWANHLRAKDDLHIGQTLTIPPVSGVVITVELERHARGARGEVPGRRRRRSSTPTSSTTRTSSSARRSRSRAATAPASRRPSRRRRSPSRSRRAASSSSGSHTSTKPPSQYSGGKFAWPVAGGYISQYFHYGHYALDIAADYGHAGQGGGGRDGDLRRLEEQRRRLPGLDRPRLEPVHDVQPHVVDLGRARPARRRAASRSGGSA